MLRATTPASISAKVHDLRSKIGVSTAPVFIPVQPASNSLIDECHRNVFTQVESQGGEVVHGWCVWEHPCRLIEAIFHTVWRSPAGNLIDITPHRDGEQRILFIPDPTRKYEGRPIDSFRVPLANDRRILRAIRMNEDFDKLRHKHLLPDGRAAVPASEVIAVALRHTERNDPCVCGSGKKFKRCCGPPPEAELRKRLMALAGGGRLGPPVV